MCEGWLWRNEQQLIYWETNEDYTLRTQSFLQKEKKSITWNDLNLLGLHMTILRMYYSSCLPKAISTSNIA